MTTRELRKLFRLSHYTFHANVDAISHQESIVPPQPAGNSLNWVVGHIVFYRGRLLELLGQDPTWESDDFEGYRQGETLQPDKARDVGQLVALFDSSQEQLQTALENFPDEELSRIAEKELVGFKTVGGIATFLHWHESYHMGQLGLLRRIAGKEGGIK